MEDKNHRLMSWVAALGTGIMGTTAWLCRHVDADAAHGVPAHDDGRMALAAFFFWGLCALLVLGGLGVISKGTMDGVVPFLPKQKGFGKPQVQHHHHYVPPPPTVADVQYKLKEQLETPQVDRDGQPQITKWTD